MSFLESDMYKLDGSGVDIGDLDAFRRVGNVVATFDYSVLGGAIGAYPLVKIPAYAVIWQCFYYVKTTFTSATDAATMAIHAVSANDIFSAAAISTGTTWDAVGYPEETLLDQSADAAADIVDTLTADRWLTVTVAVEALTAGKMHIFANYWTYRA